MDVKAWNVCLIEPNRFEGQIVVDLLRSLGVSKIRTFASGDEALDVLRHYSPNIIIASFEMGARNGAEWARAFRRDTRLPSRKAPIFVTSNAFSRAMAEECRHAGANALIGKPVSLKILSGTINKVLSKPRPFIDTEGGYVGPCRRAGIVTAGAPKRRGADEAKKSQTKMLPQLIES
jgi:CheY-like chemotaxis protein